jgi:nitronate monooxygenase
MGGVARWQLAAAVTNAGGFGCLGMVRESPERIRREIDATRSATEGSFGVNLIPAATEAGLFAAELEACLQAGVQSLVFFWDVVPEAVGRAKDAGCRVLYQVGSVAQALAAEAAGADALIAQGVEAGGHVHGGVTSLVLLPEVVEAVSIPVVASGGFATGESLIAAMALGAHGIHCGTAFLATEESYADQVHKQRVVEAASTETIHTDAFAINWPPASPVRVLKNRTTAMIGDRLFGHSPDDIAREQIAEEEGRPLYRFSTDSPLRSMTGKLDELALFAGQVCGQVSETASARSVIEKIIDEAQATLDRLRALP